MTSIRFMIVLNTVQFNLGFTIDCAPGDIILYVDDDESQHNKKEQPY